jgi:hypothetical protein
MNIERKTIGATIKQAGEDGSFEAAIATFGAVDKDGDIVERGAFGVAPVFVLPAHDSQSVALGKARIEERGDLAIAVGQFNLEIQAAQEWSSSLKFDLANPPSVQEWSWGFRIPDGGSKMETIVGETVRIINKVDLFEVSPVLRGASVGTRTMSAKAEGDDEPLPLIEQITMATTDVGALVERIHEAIGTRKEDGRRLGKDVRIATVEMAEQCAKLLDELAKALEEGVLPDDEAAKAAARFLASEARRAGVEL